MGSVRTHRTLRADQAVRPALVPTAPLERAFHDHRLGALLYRNHLRNSQKSPGLPRTNFHLVRRYAAGTILDQTVCALHMKIMVNISEVLTGQDSLKNGCHIHELLYDKHILLQIRPAVLLYGPYTQAIHENV